MTTSTEALAKERAIIRIFKGYPSWAGKVPKSLIDGYLEYVEDVTAEAVTQAIENFRKGKLDRDNGFPLTGPELAGEARRCQDEIEVRDFWDKHTFILPGSPEWLGLCEAQKKGSFPLVEARSGPYRGKVGWYVTNEQVQEASTQIAKHRRELARIAKRGPLTLPAPKTRT